MSSLLICYVATCLFLAILKTYLAKRASNPSGLPYPPGPKPLPVIGNLFDIPKRMPWQAYAAWGRQYGDVVHFTVLGDHYIVLNTMRVAIDLNEKRSKTYSDRPSTTMVNLMNWSWNLALIPYGDAWRRRRREFHQQFRTEKSVDYHPIITKNAYQFIHALLSTPECREAHVRHYSGANIMSIVYDYQVAPENDRFIDIAEQAVEMLCASTFPGAAVVNCLPILRHLPAWLPGMGFKRFAQRCAKLTTEMKDAPLAYVRERLESGVPTNCVASELLKRLPDASYNRETEEVVKDVSAMAYAAGADTTVSAINTAFLAMTLYPEARVKAQAEIDTIIGHQRLPTLEDRKSLPYVEAFVWETLRWQPVIPLSVPRSTYVDDIYEGCFIPKGTIVLMNTWAIHYDAQYFDEPQLFKPERYFDSDGRLSDRYPMTAFGMGRRICPGRHVADATLWTAVALVLATFDVTKATDDQGRDLDVIGEYSDAVVSHPLPFPCSIKVRSQRVESLIRESCKEMQK